MNELSTKNEAKDAFAKVIELDEKAIELNHNDANAWQRKGWALDLLGRHDAALQCFDKAIEPDPGYCWPWLSKGQVLQELGRSVDAEAFFAKARELGCSSTY